MIIEKIVDSTYGALDQTLIALGFHATHGKNNFGLPYVIYDNRECDATIALPERPKDELMYGGHLIVAEKTVEGRGVADKETFHRLLHEAAQTEAQVA